MPNPYLAAALREQAELRTTLVAQSAPEGYGALKVDDLKDEISRRNEDRDEDALIVPDGTKKADLIKALEADDANHPDEES